MYDCLILFDKKAPVNIFYNLANDDDDYDRYHSYQMYGDEIIESGRRWKSMGIGEQANFLP